MCLCVFVSVGGCSFCVQTFFISLNGNISHRKEKHKLSLFHIPIACPTQNEYLGERYETLNHSKNINEFICKNRSCFIVS